MMFELVRDRTIGQVLFVVEGFKTEPNLIYRVFCKIFGYQMERFGPHGECEKYHRQADPDSRVMVVNAESSNILSIRQDNAFLDNLFSALIERYGLDIDNAAIYYLFDRDPDSNADSAFVRNLAAMLDNARDITSADMRRQGLLLLSYPCVESFTVMNLREDSVTYCRDNQIRIGKELKQAMDRDHLLPNHITGETLLHCAEELVRGLELAGVDTDPDALLNSFDRFRDNNLAVFDWQEQHYKKWNAYGCLSLLCAALLDLGLIRVIKPSDGDAPSV